MTKINRLRLRRRFIRWLGIICFITAFALALATFFMSLPQVKSSLVKVLDYFDKVEYFIASLDKGAAFLVIMLLFFLKAFVPIVPLSVLFIASGMVYGDVTSAFFNILGFSLLCAVKFLWGRIFGGGGTRRFISKISSVENFMKLHDTGNKWMLALLRFIPFMPVNTVSRLYGTTSIKLYEFIFYSLLGYLPRLISWGIVGCNITNPFTVSFTAPIITLLVITGISLMLLNFFIKNDNSERKM